MEQFTNFLKDTGEGFTSLHLLARLVKIGPRHMITFKKHTAYNTSALGLIALLLVASINLYAPVAPIGMATGLLSALVSLVFVGLVGFVVNLVEPAEGIFVSDDGNSDSVGALTNKWATYFALNFVVMILVFIALNSVISLISEGRPAVSAMVANGYEYDTSVILIVISCSLISSAFVFAFCKWARKIVDSIASWFTIYVTTNLVCSTLFYYLHYVAFSS